MGQLNALDAAAARAELMRCCGSAAWAAAMAAGRPYPDRAAVLAAADRHWDALPKAGRLEAFSHHPRIGERQLRQRFAASAAWASQEQAGAAAATDEVIAALAEGNRAYEARFGHVFLVCATGKSAPEMLGILRARLPNGPDAEFAVACAEQAKITRLRLEKLLP